MSTITLPSIYQCPRSSLTLAPIQCPRLSPESSLHSRGLAPVQRPRSRGHAPVSTLQCSRFGVEFTLQCPRFGVVLTLRCSRSSVVFTLPCSLSSLFLFSFVPHNTYRTTLSSFLSLISTSAGFHSHRSMLYYVAWFLVDLSTRERMTTLCIWFTNDAEPLSHSIRTIRMSDAMQASVHKSQTCRTAAVGSGC